MWEKAENQSLSPFPSLPAQVLVRFYFTQLHSVTASPSFPPFSLPPFLFLTLSILPFPPSFSVSLLAHQMERGRWVCVCVCGCGCMHAWLPVSLHIEITCTFCPYSSKQLKKNLNHRKPQMKQPDRIFFIIIIINNFFAITYYQNIFRK